MMFKCKAVEACVLTVGDPDTTVPLTQEMLTRLQAPRFSALLWVPQKFGSQLGSHSTLKRTLGGTMDHPSLHHPHPGPCCGKAQSEEEGHGKVCMGANITLQCGPSPRLDSPNLQPQTAQLSPGSGALQPSPESVLPEGLSSLPIPPFLLHLAGTLEPHERV